MKQPHSRSKVQWVWSDRAGQPLSPLDTNRLSACRHRCAAHWCRYLGRFLAQNVLFTMGTSTLPMTGAAIPMILTSWGNWSEFLPPSNDSSHQTKLIVIKPIGSINSWQANNDQLPDSAWLEPPCGWERCHWHQCGDHSSHEPWRLLCLFERAGHTSRWGNISPSVGRTHPPWLSYLYLVYQRNERLSGCIGGWWGCRRSRTASLRKCIKSFKTAKGWTPCHRRCGWCQWRRHWCHWASKYRRGSRCRPFLAKMNRQSLPTRARWSCPSDTSASVVILHWLTKN